ncbi:MAG TPA: CoA transferase [Polyangiaceae bacterium]|nr:CoA transferase [Polyangiaceae bacterium]
MTRPLSGVRVLDFGRYIAGPYCAALLSDLGADVIRVERPEGSEDRFIAPVTPAGDGAMFLQCNRGKRGLTLALGKPAAREITRRLVRTADVVVVNLPPQTLAPVGLDEASLRAERPDVIFTLVTAYGSSGPDAERVGFDGVGQAMSGALYLSGTPGTPTKCVANYVDFTTAMSAALGTVAALYDRRATGKGRLVESSLLGSALTVMGPSLVEQALTGIDRIGTGNRSQLSGPSDTFATRDGFVLVQTVGQPIFERWARLMGEPAWTDDPRYENDVARGRHGAALSDRMQAWCSERTTAEALRALTDAKIPAGPVLAPRATLAHPQVEAMGFFESVPYPGTPAAKVPRAPVSLSDEGVRIAGRAPTLGEHTDAILAELGFSPDDIVEFRRNLVV